MLFDLNHFNRIKEGKMKHTKGPWYYHNMVKVMDDKKCKDEFWITDNPIDDTSGAIIASGLTKTHARRIVECVNACEGINPKAVPELLEACEIAHSALKGFIEHAMEQGTPMISKAMQTAFLMTGDTIAAAERTP